MQAQIRIAQGYRCPTRRSASAARTTIQQRGVAIQVRVTAEDPRNDFLPDTRQDPGYRPAVGLGIRLDDGSGYVGARVSPYYDSLLVKITASGLEWNYARRKAVRSLREFRIRGVKTNLAFLENVLSHPTFAAGKAHTTFIDETPELLSTRRGAIARRASCATSARRSSTATRRCAASPSRRRRVLSAEPVPPPVPRAPPPPGPSRCWSRRGPSGSCACCAPIGACG